MVERQIETQLRKIEDASILDVRGEIDVSTIPAFKEAIITAAEAGQDVIINLSDVTYMDSTGFGTLLSATKMLRPTGAMVHLVGCNDVIERMLQITRLNTIFGMHASEAEALECIRSGEVTGEAATAKI